MPPTTPRGSSSHFQRNAGYRPGMISTSRGGATQRSWHTGLFTHGRKQSASWPMAGIDWVRDVSASRLNGQQVK